MYTYPLRRIAALVAVIGVTAVNVLFGQTNGTVTGNEMLAKVVSETNGAPLNLYPSGYLDWLENLGDTPVPVMQATSARPIRSEPVGPLITEELSGGGFGMMAMSRPAPSDSAPDYTYIVVDLGTLGGSASVASGINNNGQVVGYAANGSGKNRPVLFGTPVTDLGTLGGQDGGAGSINSAGKIVGGAAQGNNLNHAFMWDGIIHDLGTLGGQQSSATGINASGMITGLGQISGDINHAMVYSGGSMSDLGTFSTWSGSYTSIGYGINDYGDIGGVMATNSPSRGFLRVDGTMQDVGTLGGDEAAVYGINSYAEVVGYSTTSTGDHHAMFYDYQDGTMEDLGVLSGATSSDAYGVNNLAHVVGTSGGHAFLVSNGSMKDLNSLVINNGSGWTLQYALGINDNDQIVGYGTNPSGQTHAFLLTPLGMGAWDATANLSQAQTVFANCPVKDPTKHGLVVIAHGWQPLGTTPDLGWMDTLSDDIAAYLANSGNNDWQVYEYKWLENATRLNPSDALNNATKEGKNLGKSILSQGWTHVHFIGHSAGAALIQAATDVIKDPNTGSSGVVVHETFLDPFVGDQLQGITTYGRNATWADQYFARDKQTQEDPFADLFSIAPYTESPAFHCYNVDVTYLDPHKVKYVKFASSPNGAQIEETCNDTETSHHWPVDFYANSITVNPPSDYQGFGFALSEEAANWNAVSGYSAGNGTDVNPSTPLKTLGTPDAVCTLVGPVSPPAYQNTVPDFTQLPSAQSITGTIQKFIGHVNEASGSPAWISTVITATNPVNFIAFDAVFTSAPGAQGMFTVLWDTNVIGTLDERVVDSGLQHYQFTFPQAGSYAPHVLGLRLDPFTNIQSTITLTNIVINQAGVSQSPTISSTTNTVNGWRVWRLDGQSGFNYNVQAISNLSSTNWTDVAILANTNGTVFFYDQDQDSYNQRFYRAVAP